MSSYEFGKVDLNGVDPDSGFVGLPEGVHTVISKKASWDQIGNTGNWKLTVDFEHIDGKSGGIRHVFNLKHSSEKAMEIAKRQLKAFLERGGHSDPDHPGSLDKIRGLTVRIHVVKGKSYIDKGSGQERQGRNEIKAFLDNDGSAPAEKPQAQAGAQESGDVPF